MKTKKKTRKVILQRKRDAEKARYLRIKNDPIKLAEQKEKDKLKFLNQKEKGIRKLISEMTTQEKREAREKWRVNSATYYSRLAMKKKETNSKIN